MSMKKDRSEFCIVYSSTPSQHEAEIVAQELVQKKLAACIQITPTVSVFSWKGLVQKEPEWRLMIKTRHAHLSEIQKTIKSHHSYDLPELIVISISGGSEDYLNWIADNT